MKNQIEIKVTHEKSNIELLLDNLRFGEYARVLDTKLGSEEAGRLRNSIERMALLDANNIRKEAHIAVIKLSAALETTTRLLADAQEQLEGASQTIAELSMKRPEATND